MYILIIRNRTFIHSLLLLLFKRNKEDSGPCRAHLRKTQQGRILLNSLYCRNTSMLLQGPREPREVCLYTRSPHPLMARHDTSPGTQFSQSGRQRHVSTKYGLVYTTSIMVHLRSFHDSLGYFQVYEEVRCKS